jgi:hypothetical protein
MISWDLDARMIPRGAIRKTEEILRSSAQGHTPGLINVGAISDLSTVSSILEQ